MKVIFLKEFFSSLKILISTKASGGATLGKLSATLKFSTLLSLPPMLASFAGLGTWAIENSMYINFIVIALMFDWILGTFKHWIWLKDFHWRENIKGLLVKTALIVAIGFVVEGLRHLTRDYQTIVGSLIAILRLSVFMYPASSIIRSSRVISEGRFPPQRIYDAIESWQDMLVKKK